MPRDCIELVTLKDLVEKIEADLSLSATKRRDWISAIRSFAKHAGKDLGLAASPLHLRALLKKLPPSSVSAKTWSNIRSNLQAALRFGGMIANGQTNSPTKEAWASLRMALPSPRFERGLSRLLNWFISSGVSPSEVEASHFEAFRNHLEDATLIARPDKPYRDTCQLWNRAVHSVAGWPKVQVPVPSNCEIITLGEEAFPESFRRDLEDWERCVSGKALLNDRSPSKPLRRATYEAEKKTFVRCASILVREGMLDTESVTSLAVLVVPEHARAILQFRLDRHDNAVTRGTEKVAHTLLALARHWVRADSDDLEQLDDMARKLSLKNRGMSTTSKERLKQFADPEVMSQFLKLPWVLAEEARKINHPRRAATTMRLAIIIAVGLSAPVRRRNLCGIHLDRHISIRRHKRKVECHLHFPASETKTKVDMDFVLNPRVTALLTDYRDHYRKYLIANQDDRWLFPGQKAGEHLTVGGLTDHMSNNIAKRLKIIFNMHLFRHLAAKIYLDRYPEDVATVQQLLGHKQTQTTIDFYCDLDRARALARFDQAIFGEGDEE